MPFPEKFIQMKLLFLNYFFIFTFYFILKKHDLIWSHYGCNSMFLSPFRASIVWQALNPEHSHIDGCSQK